MLLEKKLIISKPIQILLFLFLFLGGLYFARGFLVPLTLAALLATLLLPAARWLETKGTNRSVAALICLLAFLVVAGGVVSLIVWQVSDLASDVSTMQKHITGIVDKIRNFLSTAVGISPQQQEEIVRQQQKNSSQIKLTSMLGGLMSFATDFVLFAVYTFLFILFRGRLRSFVLMLVSDEERKKTERVIGDSANVAYKYLSGLSLMIVMLWVLYSIGFSLVGLKSAVFFAILCGLLEIVPFIGNLTGTSVAVLMAASQGEGSGIILGVLATYIIIQFVQTYILEPLVVGAEVNINPLFTIMVLVLGEIIWGIPGMILAIPLLGITKIIFDNVESLKPFAYLIGSDKKSRKRPKNA